MDTPTKVINIASVVLGIIVGLGTGWYVPLPPVVLHSGNKLLLRAVYNLVQEKVKHATGLPQYTGDTTPRSLERAPLLRDFSPPRSEEDQPQPPQPRSETRIKGRRSPKR